MPPTPLRQVPLLFKTSTSVSVSGWLGPIWNLQAPFPGWYATVNFPFWLQSSAPSPPQAQAQAQADTSHLWHQSGPGSRAGLPLSGFASPNIVSSPLERDYLAEGGARASQGFAEDQARCPPPLQMANLLLLPGQPV